jgi:hypothetical protein
MKTCRQHKQPNKKKEALPEHKRILEFDEPVGVLLHDAYQFNLF